MISRDEPMVLVVSKDGMVRTICYLGHATLDGNEYDRVRTLAALHLCDISITTMEETWSFSEVIQEVEKAIK